MTKDQIKEYIGSILYMDISSICSNESECDALCIKLEKDILAAIDFILVQKEPKKKKKYKTILCIEGNCDNHRMEKEHVITHYLRCEKHHKRFLEYARKSRNKREDKIRKGEL